MPEVDGGPAPPPIEWIPADTLGACEAAETPGADPITRSAQLGLARAPGNPRVVHLLDIDGDPDSGLLFTVGAGGLFVIRPSGDSFEILSQSNQIGLRGAFDKVSVLGDGLVAISSRNRGLSLVDASTPASLRTIQAPDVDTPAGMDWSAPHLYVTSHLGEVTVLDLSDPNDIGVLGKVSGLGNPWAIHIEGQRAYVADNTLGLVVLDVSSPDNPTILRTVNTAGGAQDLWLDGETLYVAVGSAGVEAFSMVDPDNPVSVSLIDVGSAVVSVAVSEGVLWAADHESVIAIDIADPSAPVPLGGQRTEQWAMHVYARGDEVFVADWGQIVSYSLAPELRGPDLDVSRRELFVVDGETDIRMTLTNRGSEPLHLLGASIDDPRFRVEVEQTEVAAGASGRLRLIFDGDASDVNTRLCLATNDGDEGVMEIPVLSNPSGTSAALGEPAPDFVLRDLDGETYQLSEQLGHPVVLMYFATW